MKRFIALCTVFLLLLALPVGAADLSFNPATYNEWGETVIGASGYQATATIDGRMLGVDAWRTPTDMTVSPDGKLLFVLDAGNNRVTMCNADLTNGVSIDVFVDADGVETTLNGPTGIYFDGTNLYIADKGNGRVICCDTTGKILHTYTKPESALFPQEREFLPTRVVADTNGVAYVICEGVDQGAVMYDREGEFLGYIGSNKVQATISVIFNNLIKKLVNEEAQENMVKYTPVEFTNFTIDKENFIYTCTNVLDVNEKIKKLNASGVNIFSGKIINSFQQGFGDVNPPYVDGATAHSRFVDVAVADDGSFFGLDFTNMKIFAYDENTNLLFTFGGPGTRTGLFLNPVAVDIMGDSVLVLDTTAATITRFDRTEFGNLVDEAMNLYSRGQYTDSVKPWNDVLKYNSNYTMAYIGLGKAHLELNELEKALEYFEIAHYEPGYNEAYRILRVDNMRGDFPIYFGVVLLLLFVIYGRQIPVVKRLFAWIGNGIKKVFARIGEKLSSVVRRRRSDG